jgi:glycosyltransferase involved in cell wall biosynthesis
MNSATDILDRPLRADAAALLPEDETLIASSRIIVVMPAYNAARTLEVTWRQIPPEWVTRVILVDDCSRDATTEIAKTLPLDVIAHPHNVGYGGNQKTCYLEALRQGADVIVMLHPDGQYNPALIPELVRPLLRGDADIVLGSRFLFPGGARKGGMPLYKYISNRFLTTVENAILGRRFAELHTGYRAYTRRFLETVPFLRNSNDFVFDTEIIAQAVAFGFAFAEVPVSTRYFPEASSADLGQSLVYGLKTLWTMVKFAAHRLRIVRLRLFTR